MASRTRFLFFLALSVFFSSSPSDAWRSAGKRKRQVADSVQELIDGLYFFNNGTVYANETYAVVPISSIYNEGYSYLGQGDYQWQLGGHVSYLFRVDSAGTNTSAPMNNTDLPGNDLKHDDTVTSWQNCQALCDKQAPECKAWTFDSRPTTESSHGCWLKSQVPPAQPKELDISGCARGVISPNCQAGAKLSTPPSGMRSAVPLGAMGGGSIELRADGRLADWQICNNGPQSPGGHKLDFDDAAFGVWMRAEGTQSAVLLRTHPTPIGADLPAVHSLMYQGAFPAARLVAGDSYLPGSVVMTAFSAFKRLNSNDSIAPAIAFHFNVSNPTDSALDASIFFSLPSNVSGGNFRPYRGKTVELSGLTLDRADDTATSTTGNLTIAALSKTDQQTLVGMSTKVGNSLAENWKEFSNNNGSFSSHFASQENDSTHGAIAAQISVPAKSSGQLVVLLTWFYPHRFFAEVDVGNFYENFYSSSEDVAEKTAVNLVPILQGVKDWLEEASFSHGQRKFKEAFPSDFLDDSLVNSAATTLKTTMYLRDGRWRQWESKSCSQMEPPHIHGYRSLFYSTVFPDLERQTVNLYTEAMLPDGTVSELFGGGCGGASRTYNLDHAMGGARGDDNAVYLLDVYQNWLFHKDGDEFLERVWPKFVLAVRWQLAHADEYGLTANLVNTFDEHGLIGNVNSYNAFMYLSSLGAAEYLANYTKMKNESFVAELQKAKERGVDALNKLLWTGTFFRSFWCENGAFAPEALQSDVLYGAVWSKVLNVELGVPEEHLVSHLLEERKRNLTPFGMRFCSNMTAPNYHCKKSPSGKHETGKRKHSSHARKKSLTRKHNLGVGFTDEDTWEAHTLDSGTLSLFTKAVTDEQALGLCALTMDKYRLTLNDFWDFRDLSSCYDDAPGRIRPVCNSHYSRQLNLWALIYALNGQKYDRPAQKMSLNPRPIVAEQWPVMLGTGSGLMRPMTIRRRENDHDDDIKHVQEVSGTAEEECFELEVYTGELSFRELYLRGRLLAEEVSLQAGDIETFCY